MVGQGLKGVEALTLDYKVGWPLSIVLSRLLLSASFASYLKGIIICLLRRAITKYQLLSRLLYFSKHVERRVLASWFAFIALFAFNLTTSCVLQDGPSVHEAPQHEHSSGDGPLLLPQAPHASFPAELRLLHDSGGKAFLYWHSITR